MRRGTSSAGLRGDARFLVCYVGIMGPQDGVDRLLRAAHHFVYVLGRRDTRFGLLGYGDSLLQLRRQATELGLDPWVVFTGRVSQEEIHRWLSSAHIGVTPDPRNEFNDRSTMNKTLEYMAHEVPVVASDLTETRRSAGGAAIYVDDEVAMAEAIATLLDDPARRKELGHRGRARIEGDLSWRHQAPRLVRAYRSLIRLTDDQGRQSPKPSENQAGPEGHALGTDEAKPVVASRSRRGLGGAE
jgi:glycosyltransferase involved in cell wall biosynthesis